MTARARFASPGWAARFDRTERRESAAKWPLVTSKPGQGPRSAGPARTPRSARTPRRNYAPATTRLRTKPPMPRIRRHHTPDDRSHSPRTGLLRQLRPRRNNRTIGFAGGNRARAAAVRAQAGNVVFRGDDRFFLHLKLPCVRSRTLAGRLDAGSMLHRAASLGYRAFSDSCVRWRQHSRRRATYATRSRKLTTPADLAQCTQQ